MPPPPTSTVSLAPDATSFDPPARAAPRPTALGLAGAAWGVGGHLAVIAVGVVQLARAGLAGLAASEPGAFEYGLTAACVALLCFFQGYRGFQLEFSRLLAARAADLARHPRALHVLLAPLHACGLVHATRRRRIASTLLYVIMVGLALGVQRLPGVYRAAIDLGVASGLLWGGVALIAYAARAAAGRPIAISLDLPEAR